MLCGTWLWLTVQLTLFFFFLSSLWCWGLNWALCMLGKCSTTEPHWHMFYWGSVRSAISVLLACFETGFALWHELPSNFQSSCLLSTEISVCTCNPPSSASRDFWHCFLRQRSCYGAQLAGSSLGNPYRPWTHNSSPQFLKYYSWVPPGLMLSLGLKLRTVGKLMCLINISK